ncbi:substrate-binding domain-containing protein [Sphingobium sp. CFD-2]|uniref:substrate-binding domain-containing protein n=1 Tax=Sphingobium sp. CFD-2 TaxID=2878542 RepID=UPI00214B3A6D|nr:substrate-binding domain-containing protein [Sphingobium sp. CFD-2]
MKRINSALFLATVASMALASGASAQSIPAPSNSDGALHGAGASAIQNVLVQELNCIGGNNQLGVSSPNPNGQLTTIAEPTIGSFNCATTEVQPNFEGKYVATGSGFGRQAWRSNSNQFFNAGTGTGTTGVHNPFVNISGNPLWSHVQFAFSEGGASPSDIQAYKNTSTGAVTVGGAPIQFPKYVLPVAVVYNPIYASQGATNYRFNVTNPQTINSVNAGGLRLSRELYCKVFNGTVRNWNDALFTAANGGTSLRDTADNLTRWNTIGVPVRLVGRLDRSGTTDIFTRALAEQCDSYGTNNYTTNAEALPYARVAGAPDFSGVRADTPYSLGSSAALSGTAPMIGNQYFNRSTGTIVSVSGGSASTPSVIGDGTGLFLVADGSSGVRDAILAAPDVPNATTGATLFANGKIGYIASDFVAGSASANPALFAAALQQKPSVAPNSYHMPTAGNAQSAFGTSILPPQSDSAGAYVTTDTRLVRNPAGGADIQARRNNPVAWYDVLYNPVATLADPNNGYAITGTTQFLGHQCYQAGNRRSIVEFVMDNFDEYGTTSTGAALPVDMFGGGSNSIVSNSNIGVVPINWQRAIRETFFQNTSGGLGALNLWMQNSTSRGTTVANTTVCGSGGSAIGA